MFNIVKLLWYNQVIMGYYQKSQRSSKKTFSQKIKLWALILVILFSVFNLSVYTSDQVHADNQSAPTTLRKQIAMRMMKDCLGHIRQFFTPEGTSYTGAFSASSVNSKTVFADYPIHTGVYYEKQMQGKVNDGAIYCSQGVWEEFLEAYQEVLLNGAIDLICNKNSRNSEGLGMTGGFLGNDDTKECETSVLYYDRNHAEEYLKKLYNEARDKDPQLPEYEKVDVIPNKDLPGLLFNDFIAGCTNGGGTVKDPAGRSGLTEKVSVVNPSTSALTEVYYVYQKGVNEKKSFNTYAHGKKSCGDMIKDINNNASSLRDTVKTEIENFCRNDKINGKSKASVAQDRITYLQKNVIGKASIEAQNAAKQEISALSTAIDNDNWTENDGNGGIRCLAIRNENGDDTSSQYTPPDNKPDGDNKLNDAMLEQLCFDHAGALSFWLCPTIVGFHQLLNSIYDFVEPMMMVNEKIVEQISDGTKGENSSIFVSWTGFRDMSNIIFVILFLMILFSQLTGYGIDNYGIKRMLPKLIVMAILVNLSFIICAVAVDLSNIFGKVLRNLFDGFIVSHDNIDPGFGHGFRSIFSGIINVRLLEAGAAAAVAIGGWSLIVPLALFLLSAVASLFFAAIMLGMRQALVVILIIVSPIAFVMNILPNTQNIYKKWLDAFKGILLLYPTIGLVLGASDFAGRVLMANNDKSLFMAFIAGIVCCVPYFMIPAFTKKALDAVDGLGGKIQGFGSGLKGRVTDFVGNSDKVKNFEESMKQKQAQIRANRFLSSPRGRDIAEKLRNNEKVSLYDANRYKKAIESATTTEQASIAARAGQAQYNSMTENDGFRAQMSSIASNEDQKATENLATMLNNGDFTVPSYTDSKGNARGGGKINPNNLDDISEALAFELSKGKDADGRRINVLTNHLNSKGKRGKIDKAIKNAEKKDKLTENVQQSLSQAIMEHRKDYKDGYPALDKYAKHIQEGNYQKLKGTEGIESLTAESFLDIDSEQAQAYMDAYKGNTLSNDEKQKLEEIAHLIGRDQRLYGRIRKDDYGEALKTFAGDIKWDDVFSGKSIYINKNGNGNGNGTS